MTVLNMYQYVCTDTLWYLPVCMYPYAMVSVIFHGKWALGYEPTLHGPRVQPKEIPSGLELKLICTLCSPTLDPCRRPSSISLSNPLLQVILCKHAFCVSCQLTQISSFLRTFLLLPPPSTRPVPSYMQKRLIADRSAKSHWL